MSFSANSAQRSNEKSSPTSVEKAIDGTSSSAPFERGGDGAGVGDVVAEVRAEVDAGDDEIGPVVPHQLEDGQVDAIGRRAVDDVFVLAELQHPQRTVQRERMRRRALLAIGRDDDDLDAVDAPAGVRQLAEPFAVDAVVVGDEDAGHGARMVAHWLCGAMVHSGADRCSMTHGPATEECPSECQPSVRQSRDVSKRSRSAAAPARTASSSI